MDFTAMLLEMTDADQVDRFKRRRRAVEANPTTTKIKRKKVKSRTKKSMEDLTPDIIRDILLKLPYKSLINSQCVCRHWYSLINDPYFVDRYRPIPTTPSCFLAYYSRKEKRKLHFFRIGEASCTFLRTKAMPRCYTKMLPSSYGLICLYGDDTVAVYNHIKQEIVTLEDFPQRSSNYRGIGFGFHPSTRKYKVVCLEYDSEDGIECHVLTVCRESSHWRTVETAIAVPFVVRDVPAVCANGVLYWETGTELHGLCFSILSFDLESEELRSFSSPGELGCCMIEDCTQDKHLVELQGSLCVAEMNIDDDNGSLILQMDIWALQDPIKQDWVPLYRLVFGEQPPCCIFVPLRIWHDKVLLLGKDEQLYSYDLSMKSLEICSRDYGGDVALGEMIAENQACVHALAPVIIS